MEQSIINRALHYVIDLLDLINHYQYHNINHTLDVYARAGYLCDKEFINEQDKNDVLIAALFHDTGFIEQYEKNEKIGAKIARKYLESIDWPEERIVNIERLIMATVLFSEPKNKLEQIMQDADLDNL
jgi:HD superfamily phosphodiesterase